jgi:hypothetical protein
MYYRDANGIDHESYDAACAYYGADSPAQAAAEEAYYDAIELQREAALLLMAGFVAIWPRDSFTMPY